VSAALPNSPDLGNVTCVDADISTVCRQASAIDYQAVADDKIECHEQISF
jgi:hypothetical protein